MTTTRIQQGIFVLGLLLLAPTFYFPSTWLYYTWCHLAAVVVEGLLARWLVIEEVRQFPNSTFWRRVAPATLPFIVMLVATFHMLGFLSSYRP